MPNKKINYSEFQSLYELCTQGKDLREFCRESGVNYDKFVSWQRHQSWNQSTGKTEELPVARMSAVTLTGIPESGSTNPVMKAPSTDSAPIRFIQINLNEGVMVKKYNTSIEEVITLLAKLSSVLC